jgi:hypothetical protein
MVLNGFAVLSGLLCALRLLLAAVVVVLGVGATSGARAAYGVEQRGTVESRSYLLLLSAAVLMALNAASWPVLYLFLQSCVREWPGVMCIYGVTQIGSGTLGASRFLPPLVAALQWIKPLVLFASGAACVLYLINRGTPTGPLLNRVLAALTLARGISLADSAVEAAYFVIPRTELRPSSGCCTNGVDAVRRKEQLIPRIRVRDEQRSYLIAAYYGVNLAVIAGSLACAVLPSLQSSAQRRWLLYAGGIGSVPISMLFLTEVAAPAILELPFHHCAYDLVSAAPESVAAAPLFLFGCCCIGWSWVALRFGRCEESRPFLTSFVARLSFLGSFGYLASLVLVSIELLLV